MVSHQNQVNEQGTIPSRNSFVGFAGCDTTSNVTAQNATTNATNAVGNASASVNHTSEVGQNFRYRCRKSAKAHQMQ